MHPMVVRWNDTDVFGHVNNAEFYAYFDTAVVAFLLESGAIGIATGDLGMVVVESGCRYHAELRFGETVAVGLRVSHVGRTSVRYDLAVFAGDGHDARADGHFVHVFIDRASKRPVPIPEPLRAHLGTAAEDRL